MVVHKGTHTKKNGYDVISEEIVILFKIENIILKSANINKNIKLNRIKYYKDLDTPLNEDYYIGTYGNDYNRNIDDDDIDIVYEDIQNKINHQTGFMIGQKYEPYTLEKTKKI